MSRAARDWAWSCGGLTPAQRLVLLALAERADDHGESCFPSLRQLEHMTELSRRGITKALAGLDGYRIERERGGAATIDQLPPVVVWSEPRQTVFRRWGTRFSGQG